MQEFAHHRTPVVALRWIARLWSLATILLVAGFIVGEGVNVSAPAEALGFVLFPFGICLGMAFAWSSELVGGAVTVVCLLTFYILHLVTAGTLPAGLGWVAFAAPGFLFLLTWGISRNRETAA